MAVLRGLARAYGHMKANSKRGSAVLDAPEEMLAPTAPEVPWAGSGARGPAPAGAFQRAYAGAYEPPIEDEAEEEPYVPMRGKVRFRVRGMLRTLAGRIVLGVSAFLVL